MTIDISELLIIIEIDIAALATSEQLTKLLAVTI